MLDNFLDSVEAPLSEDEDIIPSRLVEVDVQLIGSRSDVQTVVVAVRPSTAALSGLCESAAQSARVFADSKQIGEALVSGTTGFLFLDLEVPVLLDSIFSGFSRVVVLHSQQGSVDDVFSLSTSSEWPALTQLDSNVTGLPAQLMTRCLVDKVECAILINQHRSIRVELLGLVHLQECLCAALASAESAKPEAVRSEFKKLVPINTKVPLYT